MHPQVSWILSRQVALTVVLAIAAGLVLDVNAAVSVVVGGSIGVVANLGYVLRAMRMSGGNDPVKVYQAQAAGEGFKFLLTLVGFALVFLGYGTLIRVQKSLISRLLTDSFIFLYLFKTNKNIA